MTINQNRALGATRRLALLAVGGVALATLAACNIDETLAVATPDVVAPENVQNAAALPAIQAAAIGDFQVAFTGNPYTGNNTGTEGIVTMGGLFADELVNAETFPTRVEVDMRNINEVNSTMEWVFRWLQRARNTTQMAADAYAKFSTSDPAHAEMLALNGYTFVLMAENYCSGAPISRVNPDGSFSYGAALTTKQLLDSAIAKFNAALAIDPASGLAMVGKARAQLDLGNKAAAAVTAADVPSDYQYVLYQSANSDRQWNGVFYYMQYNRRFSVAETEGTNGLPFRTIGAKDDRLAVSRNAPYGYSNTGFDASTPMYVSAKVWGGKLYDAPMILASGVEARLIEAEAAVGNPATVLADLNEARANAPTYHSPDKSSTGAPEEGSSPAALTLADIPATTAGQVDLVFRERAVNLYLTGHRVGDLRRLIGQYGRAAESVFPTGTYFKGGTYGTDTNLPVPFQERNNATFKGCLNRDPWNLT